MPTYEIIERETAHRYTTYYVEAATEKEAIDLVENGEVEGMAEEPYEGFEWIIDEVHLMEED